jgi:hypothetical protein
MHEHGSTSSLPEADDAVEHGDVMVSVGAMDDGFYMADTGPGIPGNEREEVFNAEYSTNEEGLGLACEWLSNFEKRRSIMLEIRDGSEQVLFSGTADLEPDTATYHGSELDVEIHDTQQYTTEVTDADCESLSETFSAKCGPALVFETETGASELRDDELDHLGES